MKKLLSTLLFIITTSCYSQEIDPLSVGWEDWYPYQYLNDQQQPTGLDIEIFKAIMLEAGIDAIYQELPWKRHLRYIKTGQIDVALGASYTKNRAEHAYYSFAYRQETVKLYVNKASLNNIQLLDLADIKHSNYIIGVEHGYFYGEKFSELMLNQEFKKHISHVIDLEQNVKMLLKGHIDGFLAEPITMQAMNDKYQLKDKFAIHPISIHQANIHIMLSRKACSLATLQKINQAIEQLQQLGILNKIINRWTNESLTTSN